MILLAAVLLVVVLFVTLFAPKAPAFASSTKTDTTVLEKTTLAQVVSADGTIQSTSNREVTSALSYDITEVLASVGDTVIAGDELVVLDTSELEITIQETRQSLSTQQASDSLSRQQAQRNLNNAIETRDSDAAKYDNDVNSAQNNVNSAHANANNAQSAVEAANAARDAAHQAWENAEDDDPEKPLLWATYESVAEAADAAQQTYNAAGHAQNISAAEAALETAKTTRDTINKQNNQTVQTYQDTLDNLNASDSSSTLRNQLASYQRQLENAVITAPISGTVTQVNVVEGDSPMAAAGALFVIEDTSSLEVPLSVAEYDVNSVALGMQAEIYTDAEDSEMWRGTVTDISPAATDTSGNFTVTVKINATSELLKSGMSAEANILIEEKANVYAVPFDAVVEDETGTLVVYELLDSQEGEPDRRAIPVSTGMESDYYIEIMGDGLVDGLVILNDPLGVNVTQEAMGFPMGGGF